MAAVVRAAGRPRRRARTPAAPFGVTVHEAGQLKQLGPRRGRARGHRQVQVGLVQAGRCDLFGDIGTGYVDDRADVEIGGKLLEVGVVRIRPISRPDATTRWAG